MFASGGCGDLPHCLRPVFVCGNGVSPREHAYRGRGMFALHFSCTDWACAGVGLRPAGRRVRGCIARGQVHAFGCAWSVLRVRVRFVSGVGVLCRRGYVCSRGSGLQKYGRTVLLFCGTVVLKFSAFYSTVILKFPEQDLPDFISEEY